MPRDEVTLSDIVEACRAIEEFLQGIDRETFLEDRKTRSATLHELLVLGEATKRLSQEFRAGHSEIPWSAMAGMRDVLIHGYDQVDLEQVWKSASVEVPQILSDLERLGDLNLDPEDDV
jgi:uncharacterized protein with HEPN domain